ncbi:MAG: DUF4912 domain-containing protein [Candidatus Omnitrophota bacterium]|jgi:hypothetical protein
MRVKKMLKKKKTAKTNKALRNRKAIKRTHKSRKVQLKRRKQISLVADELTVEKAKFFPPQPEAQPPKKDLSSELPFKYGQDKITLMVRDPSWLYVWWEVKDSTVAGFETKFKDIFWQAKKVLRVYDVTDINFNGRNAHRYFDIEVGTFIGNWFIEIGGSGRSWCVDLGLLFPDGRFVTILRSNTVATPPDGPSDVLDEEWMIPDYMFARLYGMGFGFGKSSPVGQGWQERFRHILSSGVSSGASSILKK